MLNYSVAIKASAQKELDAVGEELFARIDNRILALAANPRPSGCKKLRGYKNHWRIRARDWRIICVIDDRMNLVTITRIAHRREVYEP